MFWIRNSNVIPIKSKKPPDVLAGLMEGLQRIRKRPKLLYTDEEGRLDSNDKMNHLEKESIEIHKTPTHPFFAERFVQTHKEMLSKRIEHDQKKVRKT